MMKGHRSPYRLRADGQLKGLTLERQWPWHVEWNHPVRPYHCAERTRSPRWQAGTRRTKRLMRGDR